MKLFEANRLEDALIIITSFSSACIVILVEGQQLIDETTFDHFIDPGVQPLFED